MDISHLSYFWQDKETWFLEEVKSGIYEIVGRRKDGEGLEVIIEDDGEYEAVIQKMLNAGSKIITAEESQELFRLNIFRDVDAKAEQRMIREHVNKQGFPEIEFEFHEDDKVIETSEDLRAISEQTMQTMLEEFDLPHIESTNGSNAED